jgi:HprK-related kinase A
MNEHGELYRGFECADDGDAPIRITVEPTPFSLFHRRRFVVRINDQTQFEPARPDEVLPYIEWAMNFEVPKVYMDYLQFHASSLEIDGGGIIFPGSSGSGKSTLTAGLVARGARYLCDEFALVDRHTLAVQPYPRAICIKKPSFLPIERAGLPITNSRYYFKGSKGYVAFLNPYSIRDQVVGTACPVRHIIFPTFRQGATPTLTPMSRAETAFELHRVCFNLLSYNGVGLDVIAAITQRASCYKLTSGDLRATCRLVERLVASKDTTLARSA